MWLFHLLRAELGAAEEIANQALRFAQRCQDPSLLVTAHIVAGVTCFHRGQLAEAMTHLEQGLALDDDSDCHASIFLYDSDLLGACLNYRAWTLWHRGYPAQALENSQQALARTQRRFHRFTHCFALDIAAGLHQFRREEAAVREMAEAETELARENEFPFWLAQRTIYRGWARVQEGQTDEGIEQIQQGVEMARTLHSNLDLPHYLWLLAEGYGSQGKFDLGLTTLEEALLLVIRTEERYWEAEIHRLKGELLLAQAGKNLS
jgi:predicted ATPase